MELYSPLLTTGKPFARHEIEKIPPELAKKVIRNVQAWVTRAMELPVNLWMTVTAKKENTLLDQTFKRAVNWRADMAGLREEWYQWFDRMEHTPVNLAVDSGVFGMLLRQDPMPLLKSLRCSNLEEYCGYYAEFIRKWSARSLRSFFYIEMDVLAVRGYSYAQQLAFRRRLREETGIPPVPVYQAVLAPTTVWVEILENESPRVAISLSAFRIGYRESDLLRRPETYAYLRVLYRMARQANKQVHLLGVYPSLKKIQQSGLVCDSCDTAAHCYHTHVRKVAYRNSDRSVPMPDFPKKRNCIKHTLSDVYISALAELIRETRACRALVEPEIIAEGHGNG